MLCFMNWKYGTNLSCLIWSLIIMNMNIQYIQFSTLFKISNWFTENQGQNGCQWFLSLLFIRLYFHQVFERVWLTTERDRQPQAAREIWFILVINLCQFPPHIFKFVIKSIPFPQFFLSSLLCVVFVLIYTVFLNKYEIFIQWNYLDGIQSYGRKGYGFSSVQTWCEWCCINLRPGGGFDQTLCCSNIYAVSQPTHTHTRVS